MQSSKKVGVLLVLILSVLFFNLSLWAGERDGGHFFSLDPSVPPATNPQDIMYSSENGSFMFAFNITAGPQDIDAFSGADHPYTTLADMFSGYTELVYSIDGDSDLYEFQLYGPEPDPLGAGRNWFADGHFANQAPHTVLPQLVHDDENDLGLAQYDLDALESEYHGGYIEPFPGHPISDKYFSLEESAPLDNGDIFKNLGSSSYMLYLADEVFAPVIGFDPNAEQLDALVLFDVAGNKTTFDEGTSLLDSDTIFFSLAPGTFDPVGDNIYWYSATGIGGLYLDPGYESINIDALDVHNPVPEPQSLTLMIAGILGGVGILRFRKRT
ncbi:MAG: hypothetical protein D6734_05520 [Candidatus Schekmanbacteria bacterium]|nr:MAG: hypothetical protein D6734_05520 [Candidatus Schekmanbacteria bacterium]